MLMHRTFGNALKPGIVQQRSQFQCPCPPYKDVCWTEIHFDDIVASSAQAVIPFNF